MIYIFLKRISDIFLSLVALITLLPVLIIIVAIIKLDSKGSVFYKQVRVGKDGKKINILRFRTLAAEVDKKAQQIYFQHLSSGNLGSEEYMKVKIKNIPYLTNVGRFLRYTSLDELPQLWNVLRGDMSLIGPRPPLPFEFQNYYKDWQKEILKVRPGIAGPSLLIKKSELTREKWLELEIQYAQKRSLFLDLKILYKSFFALLFWNGE